MSFRLVPSVGRRLVAETRTLQGPELRMELPAWEGGLHPHLPLIWW